MDVPFVPNSDDNLHCQQASFMMILKAFLPDYEMDWDEWSVITGFEPDKGTWAIGALLWLAEHGFEVIHVEVFDYAKFAKHGAAYMRQHYPDVAEWAIAHTNIPAEQARAKKLLDHGNVCQNRVPKVDDIKQFLDTDYLVRASVNANKLNDKPDYFGHAIVLTGYDETGFIAHDPGPPATPNRHISYQKFAAAWGDPDPEVAEIDAIR